MGASASDLSLYQKLHTDHREAASLSWVPCSVVEKRGTPFEALEVTYSVTCRGPTLVALPISYNSFTGVDEHVRGGQVRPLVVHHVPTDPQIVGSHWHRRASRSRRPPPTLTPILF